MEKMVEVERATQDELRQDLKSLFQGAIRVTLEMVLEEELKAMVGARRFERVGSRKDHRNGTYLRRLLTSLGQIDVMVPRSREGGSPADVMGRYRRRSEEVDEMMVEAYVSGVSQRKMGDVTEALLGERVGRSTVSRVAKRLDGAVEALRSAPIEGPHPYLYLDATFLDARWARKVENVSALVAYAVDSDGHRRLLAITLGPEESGDSWSELLKQLLERGLSGVELVIADEHAGLAAAVRRFLPEVRRQRCTVHLQRNVLAKVPHRLRKRVAREVAAVFRAPGLAKAKKRLAEITARWHNELPEAMRVLERGFTGGGGRHPVLRVSRAPLGQATHHEQPRAPAHRDQASNPERRRLPRPSQCTPPHHRRCSEDYCGLERAPLPQSHASRTEGGRQGSLTEASRSFLSLLHTTRDLTVASNQEVVPIGELRAAQQLIWELERALGKKTMEVEILQAARDEVKKDPASTACQRSDGAQDGPDLSHPRDQPCLRLPGKRRTPVEVRAGRGPGGERPDPDGDPDAGVLRSTARAGASERRLRDPLQPEADPARDVDQRLDVAAFG